MIECYMLVIDTNKYAGNFEREMGSYITGHPAARGEDIARKAEEAMSEELFYFFDGNLCYKYEGNSWEDYVHIYTTPDSGQFNSVAIFLHSKPPASFLRRSSNEPRSLPSYKTKIVCTRTVLISKGSVLSNAKSLKQKLN